MVVACLRGLAETLGCLLELIAGKVEPPEGSLSSGKRALAQFPSLFIVFYLFPFMEVSQHAQNSRILAFFTNKFFCQFQSLFFVVFSNEGIYALFKQSCFLEQFNCRHAKSYFYHFVGKD